MLDPEQIEKLKGVLMLSGWRDVMRPVIEGRMKTVRDMAFLLPSERPKPYKELDDQTATAYLRGESAGLEWVLHAFQNEVIVAEANRARDEFARQGANHTHPANPDPRENIAHG